EIAHSLGLKVADKIDSQEICFVPGSDYKAFLRSHLGESEFHRGAIYDVDGNFIGEHDGIELFTIGQRKGLPGGSPQRRYDVDLVLGGGWICRRSFCHPERSEAESRDLATV